MKRIIALNIQKLRKAYPMTQAQLAERLNYSEKAVSKWERGESLPDIAMLKQIADLFGVTVDYLLEEKHELRATEDTSRVIRRNHLIITLMSCMLAVLIATLVYVIIELTTDVGNTWLAFVYCVPICSVLLIVFNSIWGNPRYNYIYISVLVWSFLTSVYLTIGDWSYWLIFVVGVPAQIIIYMWSGMKRNKCDKKTNNWRRLR